MITFSQLQNKPPKRCVLHVKNHLFSDLWLSLVPPPPFLYVVDPMLWTKISSVFITPVIHQSSYFNKVRKEIKFRLENPQKLLCISQVYHVLCFCDKFWPQYPKLRLKQILKEASFNEQILIRYRSYLIQSLVIILSVAYFKVFKFFFTIIT